MINCLIFNCFKKKYLDTEFQPRIKEIKDSLNTHIVTVDLKRNL